MDLLTKEELLNYIAPCSLLCFTCPAYKNGVISKCASTLCDYFEGYYDFNDVNIPDQYRSWLAEFKAFYDKLERYKKRPCVGCRNNPSSGSGCIEGCIIPTCIREHNIDFCGECSNFPCEKASNFYKKINEIIFSDWYNGNLRIKEIGVKQYFNEKKDVSHYISYKKSEAIR